MIIFIRDPDVSLWAKQLQLTYQKLSESNIPEEIYSGLNEFFDPTNQAGVRKAMVREWECEQKCAIKEKRLPHPPRFTFVAHASADYFSGYTAIEFAKNFNEVIPQLFKNRSIIIDLIGCEAGLYTSKDTMYPEIIHEQLKNLGLNVRVNVVTDMMSHRYKNFLGMRLQLVSNPPANINLFMINTQHDIFMNYLAENQMNIIKQGMDEMKKIFIKPSQIKKNLHVDVQEITRRIASFNNFAFKNVSKEMKKREICIDKISDIRHFMDVSVPTESIRMLAKIKQNALTELKLPILECKEKKESSVQANLKCFMNAKYTTFIKPKIEQDKLIERLDKLNAKYPALFLEIPSLNEQEKIIINFIIALANATKKIIQDRYLVDQIATSYEKLLMKIDKAIFETIPTKDNNSESLKQLLEKKGFLIDLYNSFNQNSMSLVDLACEALGSLQKQLNRVLLIERESEPQVALKNSQRMHR
jgi:hypothetical protein